MLAPSVPQSTSGEAGCGRVRQGAAGCGRVRQGAAGCEPSACHIAILA